MALRKLPVLLLFFASFAAWTDKGPIAIVINDSPISYDPHHAITMQEAQIFTAIYEGLITFHPQSLEPTPGIAESWTVSADKKVFTFNLNKNARFDNGKPVTAAIVRDSWLRLLSPNENAEYSVLLDPVIGAKEYREGKLSDTSKIGIKVANDYLLEIDMKEPAAHFLKVLSHHSLSPIYPGNLKSGLWQPSGNIVGNGAYGIANISEDKIELEKNAYYWDAENVKTDKIEIIRSSDPGQNTNLFNYGKAHWLLSDADFDNLLSYEYVQMNPEFASSFFFFSVKNKVFANPKVRSGLAHILAWEKIRAEERFNYPVSYFIPPLADYPVQEGIETQNMAKGLSLLKEAGYPKGKGLPTITIRIGQSEVDRETAGLMKKSWEAALDVNVEIDELDWSLYYDSLKRDDYVLGTYTWIGDYGDPLTFLQLFQAKSNLNDSGYNDERYDKLISDSMSLQKTERYKKLAEAEKILLDEAEVLPINQPYAVNIIDLDVISGWDTNLLDIHPMKYLELVNPPIPPNIVSLPGKLIGENYIRP